VGWGIGEDELREQSSGSVEALGIFHLNARSDRSIRWVVAAMVFVVLTAGGSRGGSFVQADEGEMTRRQQGILTGMPFMANVTPRTFVDDLGRKIFLAKAPVRVISLAPSITEMLYAIGLDEEVVGVTEFCDYPPALLQFPLPGFFCRPAGTVAEEENR